MNNEDRRESVHFLYKPCANKSSLCQGDLLELTEDLRKVLEEIHPYFLNFHYKYFIVLTQSCDLVRRDGLQCKSPYITLAAVQSFDSFFRKTMLRKHYLKQENEILIMDSDLRERAYQMLERLYNNTEQDYFFLYKEEQLALSESMVAFLKVSIALKSDLHYDTCLSAKRIELADEFKAKIGWLVGNMYSRIGTTDWDNVMDYESKQKMIMDAIESRCIIGNSEQIKKLQSEMRKNNITNTQDARALILSMPLKTKYDKMLDIIQGILDKRGSKISDREKDVILRTIKSNNSLKQLFTKMR